ncbi:MAG: zinc ribbon-containing protein [Thioalkalispiraceae bacterium]|jgi:hypothetical protein
MSEHPTRDKMIEAYEATLEEVKHLWHEAEEHTLPTLKENMDKAMEKVSELGELSREEVETIGGYLKKDLEQAADFLEKSGTQVGDWLKFDLQFAEKKFADMFAEAVDKTRIELGTLQESIKENAEWHTGEITGIGILYCQNCGEALHFDKPGHIPPCPKCAKTVFKKQYRETA